MILNYNECKIVNVVWIERGILITIIYYILKKYKILLDKILIIDNKRYCKFLKIIFPELKFKTFKKHSSNNFYFNIRKIIKNQDIIIDYLAILPSFFILPKKTIRFQTKIIIAIKLPNCFNCTKSVARIKINFLLFLI